MSKPSYERKRVRRAMLIAPAAGLIGVLPFVLQLNLSILQFLFVALLIVLVSYLIGLLLGAPGYFILSRLGLNHTRYLIGYAAALVVLTPIVLSDIYALLVFAPPTLLVAGVFCYIRGPEIGAAGSTG